MRYCAQVLPITLLLLAGCGGSGGSKPIVLEYTIPSVDVTWEAANRGINAPLYLQSAELRLFLPQGLEQLDTVRVTRPATPGTQRIAFSKRQAINTEYELRALFYTTPNGTDLAEQLTIPIRIASDGTVRRLNNKPLGPISPQAWADSFVAKRGALVQGTEYTFGELFQPQKDSSNVNVNYPNPELTHISGPTLTQQSNGNFIVSGSGFPKVRVTAQGVSSEVEFMSVGRGQFATNYSQIEPIVVPDGPLVYSDADNSIRFFDASTDAEVQRTVNGVIRLQTNYARDKVYAIAVQNGVLGYQPISLSNYVVGNFVAIVPYSSAWYWTLSKVDIDPTNERRAFTLVQEGSLAVLRVYEDGQLIAESNSLARELKAYYTPTGKYFIPVRDTGSIFQNDSAVFELATNGSFNRLITRTLPINFDDFMPYDNRLIGDGKYVYPDSVTFAEAVPGLQARYVQTISPAQGIAIYQQDSAVVVRSLTGAFQTRTFPGSIFSYARDGLGRGGVIYNGGRGFPIQWYDFPVPAQ